MPTVGFLSTLNKQNFGHLLAAFEDQLEKVLKPSLPLHPDRSGDQFPGNFNHNTQVFIITRWTNGRYGTDLETAASQLVNIPNPRKPKVIAATGGATSAVIAQDKETTGTIPIIFLSGRRKSQDSDGHKTTARGIWLENTSWSVEDVERHKRFRNFFNFHNKRIFNLVHKKARVFNDEQSWTSPIVVKDGPAEGISSYFDEIKDAESKPHGKIQGLVVSADSYFTTVMSEIVAFVNSAQFGKPVSYPFREYVEKGGLMSCGPNLAEAYRALGSWAATIINKDLKAGELDQLPDKMFAPPRWVVNRTTAIAQLTEAKANELLGAAQDVIKG